MRTATLFGCSLALLALQAQAAPCINDSQLQTLQQAEVSYLLEKVPPAFRHAYEDQRVSLSMSLSATTGAACMVQLAAKLPDDELAEANQLLAADPAKRIVLFSQGYSLPESNSVSANFAVDPSNNKISHKDTLQTAELGKLRASIEMMYAMLSQARANITPDAQNKNAWSESYKLSQIKACTQSAPADKNLNSACTCQAGKLASHVSQRQLDNIYYVRTNPYAKATGAAKNFDALEKSINSDCGIAIANR